MPSKTIYLDHNASSPLLPEVSKRLYTHMSAGWGNPSSGHHMGLSAKKLLETARGEIAQLLTVKPSQIVFTSGGTESNNLALSGLFRTRSENKNRVLFPETEHPSVIKWAREAEEMGAQIVPLPVDDQGVLSPDTLKNEIDDQTALVSVMLANNETGTIQDIPALSAACNQHGVPLHCDAVQAVGKIPINLQQLGATTVSMTAHKHGGPLGIGLLYMQPGLALPPLMSGGGQERGMRPGTSPFYLADAYASSLAISLEKLARLGDTMKNLRDQFERNLRDALPDLIIHGADAERLPNTSLLTIPGVDGPMLMSALDGDGICVGTGAACSTGLPSHVLMAMKRTPAEAHSTLRVSLSALTQPDEISYTTERMLYHIRHL